EGLVEPGPEIVEVGSGGDHVENSLQVRLDGLGEPCCAVLGQSIDVLLPLDKSGIGRDGRPGGESDDGRCLALLAWWRLLWRRLPEGRVLGGRGRLGALPWLGPADVVGLEELLAVDLEPEPLSSVKHVESLPLGLTLGLAVLLRLDRVARPRGELAISEVVLGPPDQGLVVDRRGERLGVEPELGLFALPGLGLRCGAGPALDVAREVAAADANGDRRAGELDERLVDV